MEASNGAFTDLHVAFDGSTPKTGRGGRWTSLLDRPGAPWIGASSGSGGAGTTAGRAMGWQLWAAGDVFAYRGRDDAALDRFAADLADGRGDPDALDQHAVIVGWEEAARRVHLWTNRLGTVHAYARSGSAPALGTSFDAVAGEGSAELDWVAIAGFCGFGFYPADRTWRRDVCVVRPARWEVFEVDGRRLRSDRTWSWTYEPDPSLDVEAAADAFAPVWERAVARQVAGRDVVVPLSGGLDSRTVFAAATSGSGARSVRTFSYGYDSSSVELAIARRLGAVRSVPPIEQVVTPYLFDELDDVRAAVEGFQSLSLSRQVGARDELAGLGERILGGHWGDVWFDLAGAVPGRADAGIAALAVAKFSKRGGEALLDQLCRHHLPGEEPTDVLRLLVDAELSALPELGDDDVRLKALKTEQWSFRWTLASVRAYHLARPTLLPFYSRDVVDLFLRLPSGLHAGRAVQLAYLRRHHPDLAAVRWQETGRSILDRRWERPIELAGRAARKAGRIVQGRSVVERNWEVQYLGGDGPSRLRALFDRLPADGPIPRGLALGALDAFLAAPGPATAHGVDVLLTLACSIEPGPLGLSSG